MRRLNRSGVACLLALLVALPARGAITGAWAVGDGEKVYRYQADHPGRAVNAVWDGKTIRLAGLYNEVLAFQVIVEADSFGAKAVELVVDPPRHAGTGRQIGAGVPMNYGPGGSIELFSQHYMKIEYQTEIKAETNWIAKSPAPRMAGWVPDALIPADARAGRGGFPLEIPRAYRQVIRQHEVTEIPTPAVQNQGLWVDLYLPRDQSFPAGRYLGAVRVIEGGREAAVLPLEVTLLPQYLPDDNQSNVWLFHGRVEDYFPHYEQAELDRMLKHLCHRHRIDLVGGCEPHRAKFDEAMLESYRPWLDGSGFTPAAGYRGPGEGVGEKLFPIGMYGNDVLGRESEESVRRESDKWVTWFEQHAPKVDYFYYIFDEPGPSQFSWLQTIADRVHQNPGPGKKLPVFLTRRYTEEIKDAIDIWSGQIELDKLPELHRQGKQYWYYNGNRPHFGHTMIECESADILVDCWLKYIYGISTWFVWEGTQWYHNQSGPKSHLHQRVFSNPLTYLNWWWDYGNGDGVLVYPGRMPFYPDEDRGLDEFLPSIRLKAIRRGQQDCLLMQLAEQKVGRERVLKEVKSLIPRAFSEVAEDEKTVPWSEQGEDYERVRAALRKML